LRQAIEAQASIAELLAMQEPGRQAFLRRRAEFLIYPD